MTRAVDWISNDKWTNYCVMHTAWLQWLVCVCVCVCGIDNVKENMKKCTMNPSSLNCDWQDRSAWRSRNGAVTQFEDETVAVLQHKRAVRKQEAQPLSNLGSWPCDQCSRICSSRIGLYTHQLTHRWQGQSVRRLRRRSPWRVALLFIIPRTNCRTDRCKPNKIWQVETNLQTDWLQLNGPNFCLA